MFWFSKIYNHNKSQIYYLTVRFVNRENCSQIVIAIFRKLIRNFLWWKWEKQVFFWFFFLIKWKIIFVRCPVILYRRGKKLWIKTKICLISWKIKKKITRNSILFLISAVILPFKTDRIWLVFCCFFFFANFFLSPFHEECHESVRIRCRSARKEKSDRCYPIECICNFPRRNNCR